MWTAEHTIETSATPEAIWRLWTDVARWPEWNTDLERAEISGPFATGSRVTMFPRDAGQDPIELTIMEAAEPERFVDQADLGAVVVRTTHRVDRLDDEGSRIAYSTEITGPEADALGPQIGPEITADFPEVLARLVAVGEGR
jgi:uncharacterized protein YndB with AHSA1/START domain